jgi:hypothetical protein
LKKDRTDVQRQYGGTRSLFRRNPPKSMNIIITKLAICGVLENAQQMPQ